MIALALLVACQTEPTTPITPPAASTCAIEPVPHGLRRLTATQLSRTLTQILGEDRGWAAMLPPESGGFEAWPEAQPTTAVHVDAWLQVAAAAADAVLERAPAEQRFEAEAIAPAPGSPWSLATEPDTGWWSIPLGEGDVRLPITAELPFAGAWRLTFRAVWTEGYDALRSGPVAHWEVNDVRSPRLTVQGTFDQAETLTWEAELPAGPLRAELVFEASGLAFLAVAVDHLAVLAPVGRERELDGPIRRRLVPCAPAPDEARACAETTLAPVAARAFGRPARPEELAGWLDDIEAELAAGASFDDALRVALRSLFASPQLVYRHEDVASMGPGEARDTTPHERARRLATLIWAGAPDDALLACAAASGLGDGDGPCGLKAEVERMLSDPRADALSLDFARQWLGLDALDDVSASVLTAPTRDAMRAELYQTLEGLRRREAPLLDLVDFGETWADPALETWYGASGAPTPLPAGRRGLLGQAGWLAMTSLPDRTSPVLRGAWILSRLLCDPPDPPPDGVPQLPAADGDDVASLLAAHRADPGCAGCHDQIDPLGLPLEGFDHAGLARTQYAGGAPVSTSVSLPENGMINGLDGADGLAAWLRADPRTEACFRSRLFAWAAERPDAPADACALADLDARASAAGGSLNALVRAIATSPVVTQVVAP